MEEADALAQRAGVVSTRMLAVGTVENLRNRWGNLYHVHLVQRSAPHTTPEEMDCLKSWIRSTIEGADVEEKTFSGQLRFSVPARGPRGRGVGQLFRLLENNKEGLGVEYYAIGQTTMDEVFVRIVRRHGGEEENEKSGELDVATRKWWKKGGDDSYGIGPSGRKASEAGLTSALQGGRGGEESYGSSGRTTRDDDSYGSGDRSGSSAFGSGITSGAGSGNKITSGYQESGTLPADYGTGHQGDTTDRNEPYSGGHDEYGSAATGGAGFGNKSSDSAPSDSSYDGNPDVARNSDPYTGSREYGSGFTGGAGYGNKHSNREDNEDRPSDSTSGKIMEKLGGVLGNKNMEQKGAEKREQARYGDDSGPGGYGGSNDNNY
ncbi:MAG: hypothetical protein Q9184_006532 [Pyrenodesmia sp. 2 TL-2023]